MPADKDLLSKAVDHLKKGAETRLAAQKMLPEVLKAAHLLTECFRAGGKILICGNGGSAADSQHFAAEFVSRLTKERARPALPAIALTTDTSFITAYSNDIEFDGIFARQVEALGKSGDVLLAITTSGNSVNVLKAVDEAKKKSMHVIGLCGNTGKLSTVADITLAVPSGDTQYVQETHLCIEHILCDLTERLLYDA